MTPIQSSTVALAPLQQLDKVQSQNFPPVQNIHNLGKTIISQDPPISVLKLKAPAKVEISQESLNIIKNTFVVEIKNGNYTKGPSISQLSPDELDKMINGPFIQENADGTVTCYNMKPPKEGLFLDNKWYPASSIKEATAEDYRFLKEALSYLKAQKSGEPKKEEEKKEVSKKSSAEIINLNRRQAQFGSPGANGDAAAALEKQMMIVSLMRAFSAQSSKSERNHQKKEVEKTIECMTLHIRLLAKQTLNEDIEKHVINAKVIDQKF